MAELAGPPGGGKSEAVLQLMAEASRSRVAWIEDRFSLYPRGLSERGIDLERLLFVDAGGESEWVALQALRSGVFGMVVVAARGAWSAVALRRLQLATEKARTTAVILGDQLTPEGENWPLALQLWVDRDESGQPRMSCRRARGILSASAWGGARP